jgi:hypothetical protein
MRCISLKDPRIVATMAFLAIAMHASAGSSAPNSSVTSLFNETIDGINVSFSAPAGVGSLTVVNGMSRPPITGTAIVDSAPSQTSTNPLTLTFSKPITSFSMEFSTFDLQGPASKLTLEAFSGSTMVGTTSATGKWGLVNGNNSFPNHPLFEMLISPEGLMTFSSKTPFDSIELFGPAGVSFEIGNLSVGVPEPTGLTLAGVSLAGVCVSAWRRRGRKS